jgi:hypothetical protein
VSGKVKSGAISPTFNVSGGGAGAACERTEAVNMAHIEIAKSDFFISIIEIEKSPESFRTQYSTLKREL